MWNQSLRTEEGGEEEEERGEEGEGGRRGRGGRGGGEEGRRGGGEGAGCGTRESRYPDELIMQERKAGHDRHAAHGARRGSAAWLPGCVREKPNPEMLLQSGFLEEP